MLNDLTGLLRTYTRAFLSQGVGIVGLAWCLAENLPTAAAALAALVLVDQFIFLRGHWTRHDGHGAMAGVLNGWCLVVSGLDVLLFLATSLRSLGIRDGAGQPVADPLSCLAFALASFAHVDLHLSAATGGGRLLVAAVAGLGDATALGVLAAVVGRRRA